MELSTAKNIMKKIGHSISAGGRQCLNLVKQHGTISKSEWHNYKRDLASYDAPSIDKDHVLTYDSCLDLTINKDLSFTLIVYDGDFMNGHRESKRCSFHGVFYDVPEALEQRLLSELEVAAIDAVEQRELAARKAKEVREFKKLLKEAEASK